jgi:hypothetical protein
MVRSLDRAPWGLRRDQESMLHPRVARTLGECAPHGYQTLRRSGSVCCADVRLDQLCLVFSWRAGQMHQ